MEAIARVYQQNKTVKGMIIDNYSNHAMTTYTKIKDPTNFIKRVQLSVIRIPDQRRRI